MENRTYCAIWDTQAKALPIDRNGRQIDSPRTGGLYFISGTAAEELRTCDDREKVRLTDWLVEQRRLGDTCPEITTSAIGDAKRARGSHVHDRADRIIKFLADRSETLGTQVGYRISVNSYPVTPANDGDNVYWELLSHSGCLGETDLIFLLEYLRRRGHIERGSINNPEQTCTLTVEGYARLAELEESRTPSSRAFVAMWFDDHMLEVWENGIQPAIREAGYEPIRVDQQEHLNKIDDQIISEIRRSRFVVADFTHGKTGPRGGVYYEAGFAYGLNIPVIFSCRDDMLKEVHLDTRQFNHLVWKTAEELGGMLVKRIGAVIGDGPNKS